MAPATSFLAWWPILVAAGPGVWAIWRDFRQRRKDGTRDKADLVRIAQEAAAAVISDLREEAQRLRDRLDKTEREHMEMIAAKEARITMLEGELRHQKMENEALRDLLTRNGIPAPKQSTPYYEIRNGELLPVEQRV